VVLRLRRLAVAALEIRKKIVQNLAFWCVLGQKIRSLMIDGCKNVDKRTKSRRDRNINVI